jgi:alpha-glucosidase
MLYTDAPNAQERLREFVELCQRHDIPCDLFHLSSGYTMGEDGRRYVFNWDRARVPEPEKMVDHFHENGIHLSANIKPYFLKTHPHYETLRDKFIQAADEDIPEHLTLWSGGIGQTDDGAYLDFTNPDGYTWWQQKVTEALLAYGIDSTWNDNNEFQIWDDEARCNGFGQETRISLLRPVQTLLMTRASYEAQMAHAPNLRPFVLCRSGMPGIQRYAQTWSGDNNVSWTTLRYNIPMGLGLSLSGAPNTGHDVGGFLGGKPDAELFVRWVQNGIFHPRFTIHSASIDGSVNEPWMYPDVLPIIRAAIQFRYRLIPYLYSLMVEASTSGQPIIRPMVYHFGDDPRCRTESFDFMLGDSLLVASVLEPDARERTVYLPRGQGWYDFHTGDFYEGGQEITVDAPLDKIPLFAPEGAIIPMGKAMRHLGAEDDDLREVLVFPYKIAGIGFGHTIEDDGVSLPHVYT